jgi:hypothetical protein
MRRKRLRSKIVLVTKAAPLALVGASLPSCGYVLPTSQFFVQRNSNLQMFCSRFAVLSREVKKPQGNGDMLE